MALQQVAKQSTSDSEARPLDIRSAGKRVDELYDRVRDQELTIEEREEILDELVELHGLLVDDDPDASQKAGHAFLFALRDNSAILEKETIRGFIAEYVDDTLFESCEWQSPDEVVTIAEALYGLHYEDENTADQVTGYVRDLMRASLRYLEEGERHEEMFELLQRMPLPPAMLDAELVRLRNRLHLYEMRRVERKRRLLYGYLILQVLLVFIVFPLVFMYFENGVIQQGIENSTTVDLPEEPKQFLGYLDGLYWSIITSASIGYGDVVPITSAGKITASVAGVMGVLTVGVIAGLVLNWVTPRRLTD